MAVYVEVTIPDTTTSPCNVCGLYSPRDVIRETLLTREEFPF